MPNVDAPSRSAVTVTESQEDAQVAEKVTSDFLVVILDLDKMTWMQVASQRASPEERAAAAYETLKNVISSVLVFLNAHIAMQSGNGLAVYGAAAGQACLLYTSSAHAPLLARSWRTQDTRVSECLPFKQMDDAVFHGIRELFYGSKGECNEPVGIVRAFSLALCHINRMASSLDVPLSTAQVGRMGALGGASSFRHRILVLSATPDVSAQYVPMMNCIFSAQKQGIHVDVCKLLGGETVFLHQACHLTGGHYYRIPSLDGLLQTLMTSFLPSRSIRPLLMFPALDEVDFRAACFCHRRNVDIGYVCSVCLSSTFEAWVYLTVQYSVNHGHRA